MKSPLGKYLASFALPAVAAVAIIGTQNLFAQEAPIQLSGYFATIPWTGGTLDDAAQQSLDAKTILMSKYSFAATKNGKTYTGLLVGTSPFAATKTGSTTSVVVVPVKVKIGTSVFDPKAPNTCDGNISALNRFDHSPLVDVSPLKFNGVGVGTTQFTNGFMRAEFFHDIDSAYQNTLTFTTAPELSVTANSSEGIIFSSGCGELGIVSYNWFGNYLSNEITALQKSGVVKPTQFVIFLVKNVVQSLDSPPDVSNCCILGFHTAQGSPIQTWGVMDWDTSGEFGPALADAVISSHEIAEWMNDPTGNNATPAWGNIGQVGGCQGNFEVGDPLTGQVMPPITLNGYTYHVQELGFFSWYFNKDGVASLGTGGKFSGNGTFKGPSKACPPGGTF